MTFFRSLLLLCPAAFIFAQTPPPNATPVPKSPAQDRKVNPDGSVTMTIPVNPPLPQVAPDKVVLSVGDLTITAQEFDEITDGMQDQYKAFFKGPGRKQFADQLAKVLTLAQEGKRRKLDEKPEFKAQAMYQADQTLANFTYLAINKDIKIDDAAIRAYYDAHKIDFEEMRARHILIRMQGSAVPVKPGQSDLSDAQALAKAQDLVKRLKAGEDFAKLAGAESDDTGSALNGGDLGSFGHGRMVPSFEEAALKLQPGQISDPVKSQFGYHIIRLEGIDAKTLDDAKPEIEKKLRPEQAQKAMEELEKNAKVVYDPVFFSLAKQ